VHYLVIKLKNKAKVD
jgi:hypothetical protein